MKLIKAFYGSDHPSIQRLLIVSFIYFVLILFFLGPYFDFVISEHWWAINIYASLAIASLIMAPLYYRMYLLRKKHLSKFSAGGKFLAIIIGPVVIYGFIWVSFIHGAPAIYTLIFGKPYTQTIHVTKNYSNAGKFGCDYRLYSDVFRTSFPNYLCISRKAYYNTPKEFDINTKGYRSYFGYYIEHYETNANKSSKKDAQKRRAF